jgi:hypothetical protein
MHRPSRRVVFVVLVVVGAVIAAVAARVAAPSRSGHVRFFAALACGVYEPYAESVQGLAVVCDLSNLILVQFATSAWASTTTCQNNLPS